MKKSIILIVIFTILLLGLGYFYWAKYLKSNFKAPTITNGQMLQSENKTPIITESNVAYYPGANGYFARPQADGIYPGVVMIHENRGLNSGVRSMADQLAKEGYMVLAVDLLGKSVETQEEARGLTANFNQQTGIDNMKAALAYLRTKGVSKVASLGWCFGGAQSLQLALSGEPLEATIIYYGRLVTTPQELAPIKWPVLGIFGGADTSISVESVNQFDATLDNLKVPNEIYIYPGVGHAFANPSGMNYAPKETKDAWDKTLAFLKTHLKN